MAWSSYPEDAVILGQPAEQSSARPRFAARLTGRTAQCAPGSVNYSSGYAVRAGDAVIGDRRRFGSSEVRPRHWPFPVALLFVLLVSLTVFGSLAVEVSLGRSLALDELSMDVLRHGQDRPSLLDALRVVGVAGSAAGTIVVSALVLVILLVMRRRSAALFFVAAIAIAALSPLLKSVIDRPARPGSRSEATTGFFPSGHATGSMAVCAAIVALVWNTSARVPSAIAGGIAVAVVGLSAVYDGAHWPSDVVGGWALSLGWVTIVCIVGLVWAARRNTETLGRE
jgi:membrane-associated phospholipid phosphatase